MTQQVVFQFWEYSLCILKNEYLLARQNLSEFKQYEILAGVHPNGCVMQAKYFVSKYKHSKLSHVLTILIFVLVSLLSMVENVKRLKMPVQLLKEFRPANNLFEIPCLDC